MTAEKAETPVSVFASYLPAQIARRLSVDPTPITSSIVEEVSAAVLFVDITGFTALAERLTLHSSRGVEQLSRLLNALFGHLIQLVNQHGGDVIKFAGDALLAIWPVDDDLQIIPDLTIATQRAAQCALTIQSALHNYQTNDVQISLRIGVAAGDISIMHLGGVYERWELLVTGKPLIQVSAAEQQALPGEVILHRDAWKLISTAFNGTPLKISSSDDPEVHGCVRVQAAHHTVPLANLPEVELNPEMSSGFKAYLPGAILSRLAAGHTGWLAELRRVSVLFINLPDLNTETSIEQAQEIMRTLQTLLYRYEGSINKLNVDDKGTTLVAALGLPPMAHEDDAVRAVQVTQEIKKELDEMGMCTAIGVATGGAFCGSIGIDTRCEYTMVGDVVNLAARLMQAASNTIICDQLTYEASKSDLVFEELEPIIVKGKTDPIAVYTPTGETRLVPRSQSALVGRKEERALLADRLQALLRGTLRGTVIIIGEAGIGKSRLVLDTLQQAQALKVTSLVGMGDAIEKHTPYHAWRPVFNQMLNLEVLVGEKTRQQAILAHLEYSVERGHADRILSLAPLLNAVLALDIPENEITAQLDGEVRAANTREILVHLTQYAANESPLLLVLEDTQWMDSASWALLQAISQQVKPLLLVLATRPMGASVPTEYTQLLGDPATTLIELDSLPPDEMLELVCQRLGITTLPEPIADLIKEKAEGHPFFSEELAYALRDTGIIEIKDDQCTISPNAGDLSALRFPSTIQGIITSRMDRLPPPQQLTLKVASVIGRVFAFRILQDIFPVPSDRPNLPDYLKNLESLDITEIETLDPELVYIFKHIITQEVAYNLMLYAQRQQLHQAVAEWYEQMHPEDIVSYYPLLAYHWGRAQNITKTITYLEKAGEQALHNHANQEAIKFFKDVLSLKDRSEEKIGFVRHACWERQIGEAYHNLGDLGTSREHLLHALELIDRRIPTRQSKLIIIFLRQMISQLFSLFGLKPSFWQWRRDTQVLQEAAQAYALLVENYYHANETIPLVYTVLRLTNITERIDPSPELACAYANMCTISGTIPVHRLAQIYSNRARSTVQMINDLPAQVYVLLITGIYLQGIGDWEQVDKDGEQACEISAHLGDIRRLGEALTLLATAANYRGQFERCIGLFAQVYESAVKHTNVLQQAWALSGQACALLRLGQYDKTILRGKEALKLLVRTVDRTEEIRALGSMAVAYLNLGEYQLAHRSAVQAKELIGLSPPTVYSTLEGYAGVTEVYLKLWELISKNPSLRVEIDNLDLKLEAKDAVKTLQRYARVFPIGKPSAYLWEGLFRWISGEPVHSMRLWQKSIDIARELNMPYDQARAHLEILRHIPTDHPEHAYHRETAQQIFSQIKAVHELKNNENLGG